MSLTSINSLMNFSDRCTVCTHKNRLSHFKQQASSPTQQLAAVHFTYLWHLLCDNMKFTNHFLSLAKFLTIEDDSLNDKPMTSMHYITTNLLISSFSSFSTRPCLCVESGRWQIGRLMIKPQIQYGVGGKPQVITVLALAISNRAVGTETIILFCSACLVIYCNNKIHNWIHGKCKIKNVATLNYCSQYLLK